MAIDHLLLESGFGLLLESGSALLLESSAEGPPAPIGPQPDPDETSWAIVASEPDPDLTVFVLL